MLGIVDPDDRYVIEVHQYLDGDSSGTNEICVSETIGSERLKDFTEWCRKNKLKGFLGEFAGADNPICAAALADMLKYMEDNDDVWEGWTWWAAGISSSDHSLVKVLGGVSTCTLSNQIMALIDLKWLSSNLTST